MKHAVAAFLTSLLLTGPALAQQGPSIFIPLPNLSIPLNVPNMVRSVPGGLEVTLPPDAALAIPTEDGRIAWPVISAGQIQLPNGGFFPLPWPMPGYEQESAPHYDTRPLPGQPVENYNCMQVNGKACRVPRSELPLRVYTPFERHRRRTQRALDIWNQAGQQLLATDFFVQVSVPDSQALCVDWTGLEVPEHAAGVTKLKIRNRGIQVEGIHLQDMEGLPAEQMDEVLGHELGHVLGLDHSEEPGDIMYHHTSRHRSEARNRLSQRDRWMLGWLYAQEDAVPMTARANQAPVAGN